MEQIPSIVILCPCMSYFCTMGVVFQSHNDPPSSSKHTALCFPFGKWATLMKATRLPVGLFWTPLFDIRTDPYWSHGAIMVPVETRLKLPKKCIKGSSNPLYLVWLTIFTAYPWHFPACKIHSFSSLILMLIKELAIVPVESWAFHNKSTLLKFCSLFERRWLFSHNASDWV